MLLAHLSYLSFSLSAHSQSSSHPSPPTLLTGCQLSGSCADILVGTLSLKHKRCDNNCDSDTSDYSKASQNEGSMTDLHVYRPNFGDLKVNNALRSSRIKNTPIVVTDLLDYVTGLETGSRERIHLP